jgi:hypothetical protein
MAHNHLLFQRVTRDPVVIYCHAILMQVLLAALRAP